MRIVISVFAIVFTVLSLRAADVDQFDLLIDSVRKTSRTSIDSALLISEELVRLGKESNNSYAIIRGDLFCGYLLSNRKKEPIKGLIYYLDAVKQYELYPDENAISYVQSVSQNTAAIYKNINQPDIALDFYTKALRLSEQLGDTSDIVWIKRLMSETYQILDQQEQSYALIDEALQWLPYISLESQYSLLNETGVIAARFDDHERAEHFYRKLLSHTATHFHEDSAEAVLNRSFAFQNLGELERKRNNYDSAIFLISRSKDIKELHPEVFSSYNMFNVFFDLGKCYLETSRFEQAISEFNSALLFSDGFDFQSDKKRFQIYQLLAEAYSAINKFEKASHAQNKYAKYLSTYLDLKEKSAEENQRLNVELITRQYFASVESAETDTALLWIIVISIGLTLTVGSSIGYNAYQKGRIRKRLETEIKRIQST